MTINELINTQTFAIIAGDNPLNGALTTNPSTDKLADDLLRSEYQIVHATGKYGQKENSLIIIRIDYYAALYFARKYGQGSFIYAANGLAWLIYTTDESVRPAVGYELFDHEPDDNYTFVPGQGYFTYIFDWDVEPAKLILA